MKNTLLFFSMLIMSGLLIIFPEVASSSVEQAMKLCTHSLIPSIFPFMVATNIWIQSGYVQNFSGQLEAPIRKLFHLSGKAAIALLFGCLSGFPVGAKTAVTLYTDGHLQKEETEQLLLFCNNAGPAFILGVIGAGIFHSHFVGTVLWLIHIFSALIIGVLFRSRKISFSVHSKKTECLNTLNASNITKSILDAGSTILQICIYIAAFSVLIGFLTATLPPSISSSSFYPLIRGLLEISSGVSLLNQFDPKTAFILSSVLLGWSGFCIHFQVLALTSSTDLRLHKYFLGKILHAIISLPLSFAAAPILFP